MRKDLIISVIVTFCLTTALFMIIPTSSSPAVREYDPWADINDDGNIDGKDISYVCRLFGTTGDPTKNVNVTNDLLRVFVTNLEGIDTSFKPQILTAILNETYQLAYGEYRNGTIKAMESITFPECKNVTFIAGEVSGGVTWKYYSPGYASSTVTIYAYGCGGGSPGCGHVEVYGSGGELLALFTLPLNTKLTLQGVKEIRVYAEASLPYLSASLLGGIPATKADYSAFVVASLYYQVIP